MKRPELIRRYIDTKLQGLLGFISCIEGNGTTADLLRGQDGLLRRARIVGYVMKELGDEVEAPVEDPVSMVRRSVTRRARGPKGGDAVEA